MGDSGMEEVEHYPDIHGSGSGSESKSHDSGEAGWVMTLGKNILFTGLVVTSAPMVVPSILVISALGFACSLPSTVFLATYLFTESIMTKLLPLKTHEGIEDSDDQEKTPGEGKRRRTLDPIQDEDEIIEENQNGYDEGDDNDGGVYVRGRRDDEAVDMAVEMHAVSGIVVIEEGGEGVSGDSVAAAVAVPIEVKSVVVEVSEGRDDVDENEELAKGTTGLLEGIRDEGLSESPAEVDKKTTGAATSSAGTEKPPLDSTAASAETEKRLQDSAAAAVPQSAPESNSGGNANQNGSTEVLNNEKIWEQINALRVIVGYTASRQPTLMEELKALYVFTGVEPPVVSLTDPYDPAEVNGKLRSLKVIVGVK